MGEHRSTQYHFEFEDGSHWDYQLLFDASNRLVPVPTKSKRPWTKLQFCQCPHCPLDPATNPSCPVAANIDGIVEDSKDVISFTGVTVTVTTPERVYSSTCTAQVGLLSLFGLIMASSGCPHLDWLRPLARFHLPFSSLEETLFRVISLQLVREFFEKDRQEHDESTDSIKKRYEAVGILNHSFIDRIRSYCGGDADKNAIAALDVWVHAFQLFDELDFEPLRPYFQSAAPPVPPPAPTEK